MPLRRISNHLKMKKEAKSGDKFCKVMKTVCASQGPKLEGTVQNSFSPEAL